MGHHQPARIYAGKELLSWWWWWCQDGNITHIIVFVGIVVVFIYSSSILCVMTPFFSCNALCSVKNTLYGEQRPPAI